MKFLFSLVFFTGSLAFTLYGLYTLDLSDSFGRPGPGYFPLLVGVLLMFSTGFTSVQEFRKNYRSAISVKANASLDDEPVVKHHALDTMVVALLIVLFLVTLKPLGSILSMILFTGAFLAWFNRGQLKLNVVYSILLPLGVYLLFDILLRAGLPKGVFD